MIHKARNGFLSEILVSLATLLLVVGIMLIPNVVIADDEPPPSIAKVACTGCAGGCSGSTNANGCGIANYHCNSQPGTTTCTSGGAACFCDRVPTPVGGPASTTCDCYKQ